MCIENSIRPKLTVDPVGLRLITIRLKPSHQSANTKIDDDDLYSDCCKNCSLRVTCSGSEFCVFAQHNQLDDDF